MTQASIWSYLSKSINKMSFHAIRCYIKTFPSPLLSAIHSIQPAVVGRSQFSNKSRCITVKMGHIAAGEPAKIKTNFPPSPAFRRSITIYGRFIARWGARIVIPSVTDARNGANLSTVEKWVTDDFFFSISFSYLFENESNIRKEKRINLTAMVMMMRMVGSWKVKRLIFQFDRN